MLIKPIPGKQIHVALKFRNLRISIQRISGGCPFLHSLLVAKSLLQYTSDISRLLGRRHRARESLGHLLRNLERHLPHAHSSILSQPFPSSKEPAQKTEQALV